MSGHSKFANIKHKKEKNDAAKGKMFTIITGGIDLSVGCTYAITGIIVASCTVNYGMNPFLGILVGLVVGAVLGAFNGILINKIKLQPIIAT